MSSVLSRLRLLEMSARAAAASMSHLRAISARETMPDYPVPVNNGQASHLASTHAPGGVADLGVRRGGDHAPGHYILYRHLTGVPARGHTAQDYVAVGQHPGQLPSVGHGQRAEVHALEQPGCGDDRLTLCLWLRRGRS